ncbi:MAG: YodC family protein [Rhodopseudomonas palustris]|nr:YodC family protein [Rhodopseudomonas palustris]
MEIPRRNNMKKEFKEGEIVRLKSGGPDMTVILVRGGWVEVVYYDERGEGDRSLDPARGNPQGDGEGQGRAHHPRLRHGHEEEIALGKHKEKFHVALEALRKELQEAARSARKTSRMEAQKAAYRDDIATLREAIKVLTQKKEKSHDQGRRSPCVPPCGGRS